MSLTNYDEPEPEHDRCENAPACGCCWDSAIDEREEDSNDSDECDECGSNENIEQCSECDKLFCRNHGPHYTDNTDPDDIYCNNCELSCVWGEGTWACKYDGCGKRFKNGEECVCEKFRKN